MKGFTLAEVLITLGIIGIVAALTMPQLFNRTRNSHLGAQFASTISTLENAIGVYLYDNNVIVNELKTDKIGLEEYYINLMKNGEVK